MSARAAKRTKLTSRDHDRGHERLRFLIGCMTNEELCRHGLMNEGRERPSDRQILKNIDAKILRYQRAHSRLMRSAGVVNRGLLPMSLMVDEIDSLSNAAQHVACSMCEHVFIGFYLPQMSGTLIDALNALACPQCGAGPDRIRMRP